MKDELAKAIHAFLPSHGQGGGRAIYGVTVTDIRANGHLPCGEEISIAFRFVKGGTYCCTELGCHFRPSYVDDWQRLRMLMHEQGVSPGYPMTISARVTIEAGAVGCGRLVTETHECPYVYSYEERAAKTLPRGIGPARKDTGRPPGDATA